MSPEESIGVAPGSRGRPRECLPCKTFHSNKDCWEQWYPDTAVQSNKQIRGSNEIFCLHIGDMDRYQYCLCLVPTGKNKDEYERVGICPWNSSHVNVRCPINSYAKSPLFNADIPKSRWAAKRPRLHGREWERLDRSSDRLEPIGTLQTVTII
jgi:hypothetical protein